MNCSICKSHCCGGNPVKAPVLMPREEHWFVGLTQTDGQFKRLLRKQDGTCFFLQMGNHCSVYAYRPLECQLYPYVLVYKDGVLGLELHEACPQRVCAPVPEIPDSLRWLPKEWWLEFEKLET